MEVTLTEAQRKGFGAKLKLLEQAIKIEQKINKQTNRDPLIYLSAKDQGFSLEYQGPHCSLFLQTEWQITQAGQAALPFTEIAPLLKGITNGRGNLILTKGEKLTLKDPQQTLNFQIMPKTLSLELSGEGYAVANLTKAIKKVRYGSSKDKHSGVFQGVLLEFHPGILKAVTTDGFRIAIYQIPCSADENTIVIHRNLADILCQLFDKAPKVNVHCTDQDLEISTLEIRAKFSILDKGFPDYARVIPNQFTQKLSVQAEDIVLACSNITTTASNSFKIKLNLNQNITLHSNNQGNIAEHQIKGEHQGSPGSFSFNGQHLKEAFTPLQGTVEMYLQDNHPCVIRQGHYCAVLAPLRDTQ